MAFAEHDREHHPKPEPGAAPVKHTAIHKVAVKHVKNQGAISPEQPAPAKQKVNIDESLRAIYEDDAGAMPDMTKLEHRRSKSWLAAVVACVVLGLFAGAAYIGYLLFSPYVLNTDAKVDVSIVAPEHVASFETTTLELRYENVGRAPVGGGELHVNIPPEFKLTGTDPLPDVEPATWTVPQLAPGEMKSIQLSGYFIAGNGSREFLQSVVRYHPQGVNKSYEDIATQTITVGASKIALSVEAPTEAIAGEPTSFTYTVHNAADRKIESIVLLPKLPATFLITKTTPSAEKDGSWNVGALEPGQKANITVAGTFSVNHEDNENLAGIVGVRIHDGITGIAQQAESVAPVRVASSELVLRTLINGSDADQNVDFGGKLRMSTMYKNNGNRTMKDVVLTITLNATPDTLIDWATFDTETLDDKTFSRKGETLTVHKKLFPGFAELAPGAEGTFAWTLPLLKSAGDATSYDVRVNSKASVGMIGTKKVTKSIETTPFTIIPNTNLELRTGAYYFNEDDAPIGSGPLPPVVGKETKYLIAWKISNTVHDLKDITVKTQLAEGVQWTGKTSSQGGSTMFDEATRTVTWTIPVMKTESHVYTAEFEVALTPSEGQADSFAPLTTGATLTATDVLTKAILTRTSEPDTTELPRDPAAKDKGLVVKEEER